MSAPSHFSRQAILTRLTNLAKNILVSSDQRLRRQLALIALLLIALIGALDFLFSFEFSLSVFYCLPVVLGTAAAGWRFGSTIAVICVAIGIAGDLAAGAHYSHWIVPCWNATIALSTYLIIVWLFSSVRSLQREMEQRIQQRTVALTEVISERERLEKVILEIGERERSSIGRDLHDDLGQHLTGTALAGQVLGEKLQARQATETSDAWRIVRLVEEGIEKTRRLARGLLLAEVERNGLRAALQEYAVTAAEQFHVKCQFQGDDETDCTAGSEATHLYRITQESVRNAVQHGKATHVKISLTSCDDCLILSVDDDGTGLPPPPQRGQGLGLRIMAHRAGIIHARFKVEAQLGGGTLVECRLPHASIHFDA